MSEVPQSKLCGNLYIATEYSSNIIEDQKFPRVCGHCIHRSTDQVTNFDCILPEDKAKLAFEIPTAEVMPQVINDLEVGNYCPDFVPFFED